MNMVEKIARAMALESGVSEWRNVPEADQRGPADWGSQAYWRVLARAALSALAEPTEKMIALGWLKTPTTWTGCEDDLIPAWQAMIQEAGR